MPRPNTKTKSVSLDEEYVFFIKDYLKERKYERLKAGKDDTVISVIREALFHWAEKEGVLEELLKHLKQTE